MIMMIMMTTDARACRRDQLFQVNYIYLPINERKREKVRTRSAAAIYIYIYVNAEKNRFEKKSTTACFDIHIYKIIHYKTKNKEQKKRNVFHERV